MITLVTGGTKCGKSGYAERVLESFCGLKYYVATMNPVGDDAQEIIARHVEMRCGKNFITIERLHDIGNTDIPDGCGVLIECVGNLCANEMFVGTEILEDDDKVVSGIRQLAEKAAELVIVTNEVGSDVNDYSADTIAYIRQMGRINRRLAEFADNVVECVYGIPVLLKGQLIC